MAATTGKLSNAAKATDIAIDNLPLNARPTSPSMLIPFEDNIYQLPVQKINVHAEFHISTAFIRIDAVWVNVADYESNTLLVLPLNGTVTKVNIKMDSRQLETVIIPRDDAVRVAEPGAPGADKEVGEDEDEEKIPQESPYENYIPNLFRLPITKVSPGDVMKVSIFCLEPLEYSGGQYHWTLPMGLDSSVIAEDRTIPEVLSIKAIIHSITPNTGYECNYRMEVKDTGKALECDVDTSMFGLTEAKDFELSYTMAAEKITTTLIKEDSPTADSDGSFVLFVTPPAKPLKSLYTKHVIFLLDRSGSMTGEPYDEAARSLDVALQQLSPDDRFNVVAFDHQQKLFRSESVECTVDKRLDAIKWIKDLQPDQGGTDIFTPVNFALETLGNVGDDVLPYTVLITDGAVNNERDIVATVQQKIGRTRILTLGIGFYCNWYFLKMVAQIGRGFSDVVVYKEKIFPQVVHLMNMAAAPVITELELSIKGVEELEMYPFPIPDLFMGAPLTISGKYKGKFPSNLVLKGKTVDDQKYQQVVKTKTSKVIPVSKVFLKQRVDLLTARAWLDDSKEIEAQVIDISCRQGMPCPYTAMVAFERDANASKPFEEEMKEHESADKPWYRDKKKLGTVAMGGAVMIGAAAFSFGDVGATLGNMPVVGTLGDGLGDLLGGDGCGDCCGDDCLCDACGDCLQC